MGSSFHCLVVLIAVVFSSPAWAQDVSRTALLNLLRDGGNTLVMRHASSPQVPPDASVADKDNPQRERQLDDTGKSDARTIGVAIRKLHIAITDVESSPTFRALQTVQYGSLGKAKIVPELDETPQGMTAGNAQGSAWLKKKVAMTVKPKANVVLVTHLPNIRGAFGDSASKVDAGEILVVRADGKGGSTIVGRIKPSDWGRIAVRN